jgi:dTDP-glucose 4,6-dehydratase
MKRVLVTGGMGFIGSNLIRHLLGQRCAEHVVNLDKLTYAGCRANLADIEPDARYTFVQGDVADPAAVSRAMAGCDAVVHCAAESHVDRSITDATPFLQTNITGTAVVLDVARQQGVSRVIHVSTDEVYGDVPAGQSRESDRLQPNSPYAASKAAADLLARAAHVTHGVPVIITRASNNFGPYQFPEKFIPLCITNLCESQSVPLYGDGAQVREWLYVQDHCEALTWLLTHGTVGEIYNISGTHTATNRDVALQLAMACGATADAIVSVADRPGHDRRYAMDGSKLAAVGWQPRVPFDTALRDTMQWYHEHREWWTPLKERLRADPYHWLNRAAGSSASRAI